MKNYLVEYRKQKKDLLDKSYLILSSDNFPRMLRPVRSMKIMKCAICHKQIIEREFSYLCYENPVRLSPTGSGKCHVSCAEEIRDIILPQEFIVMRIPTFADILNLKERKQLELKRRKSLEREGTKLLKEGKIIPEKEAT